MADELAILPEGNDESRLDAFALLKSFDLNRQPRGRWQIGASKPLITTRSRQGLALAATSAVKGSAPESRASYLTKEENKRDSGTDPFNKDGVKLSGPPLTRL
jgi:hypothetical protein